jgi:hypothetical protein
VRHDIGRALQLLVLPTVLFLVIVGGAPGRFGLAARIYALVVCGAALVVALNALARAYPPETPFREPSRRVKGTRRPPPSLARLEQLAAIGVASSFDLQYRFLPRLRALAAGLLASRRRVALDTEQDAAKRILGDETWELVRPTRPAPRDRISRGISPDELSRVADSLEAV